MAASDRFAQIKTTNKVGRLFYGQPLLLKSQTIRSERIGKITL